MDIPMTSDKIRMACLDDFTKEADKIGKEVPLKDKIGFEI